MRSQNARDQIVQAALTIFALKGYASASMDDVCLAAGLSKGGLYHHFRTKSAVLNGVVERLVGIGALLPPFRADAGTTSLSPEAMGRMLIEVWAEAARDEELRSRLRSGYESRLAASVRDVSGGQPLAELLRIGAIIQMLTRSESVDSEAAAIRLGIERAA